ncbi:hypothetical protein BU15DRAFT_80988 [Melanogaster broomeanus]|nr:hypothetical protein BU15DRAFT_80988 [Melanogaster broomeanus]
MSAATTLTGTYYISSRLGTYLTFTDTNSGTNLTTFQYSGAPEQQWVLAPGTGSGVSGTAYTVKNVQYQTYVSYNATNNPANFVGQSSLPLNWFVNVSNVSQSPSQYLFAPDPSFASIWNDADGYTSNNNPVSLESRNSPSLFLLSAFQALSARLRPQQPHLHPKQGPLDPLDRSGYGDDLKDNNDNN